MDFSSLFSLEEQRKSVRVSTNVCSCFYIIKIFGCFDKISDSQGEEIIY